MTFRVQVFSSCTNSENKSIHLLILRRPPESVIQGLNDESLWVWKRQIGQWGSGNVDKSNFSLSLHDIDDAQFIQPVLKNCSFSTKVNMICFEKDAGYQNGKTGIIYNGWECYNQHHLIFSGGAMTCFNYARFVSSWRRWCLWSRTF